MDADQPEGQMLHRLVDYVQTFWRKALIGAGIGLVCAGVWLVLAPGAYTAKMAVAPTPAGTIATRAAPADESWSRRELVDLVQRGSGDTLSDFERFLHLMISVPVAQKMLDEKTLPPQADFPSDPYDLAAYLRRHVIVKMIGTTPIWQVSFRHKDRDVALSLLRVMHAAADGLLRDQARQRVQKQLAFLNGRLASVMALEQRAIVARQLAEQENALMMVSVDVPFAAEMIQPPYAPARPDWPSTVWILCAACLASAALALTLQGMKEAWRKEKHYAR